MPNAATLINADSGDTEYYTPTAIVEAARACMGGIDLDPASSAVANERVRATRFFTKEDDGLAQPWEGRIWLNHPFGRVANPRWVNKAVAAYDAGHCTICMITYAATSEKWFQPLMLFPQCFLHPRTNYFLPDGSLKRGVTKGSVVTYLGRNGSAFVTAFGSLGVTKDWMPDL